MCDQLQLQAEAQGEAFSIIFPFLVSPALPFWHSVPNLTLLWEHNLWQENEMGD